MKHESAKRAAKEVLISEVSSSKSSAFPLQDNRPESIRKREQVASQAQSLPLQRKPNNTGLPDNLKSGIENLSGLSMDDVKVHYNSGKPAQLNAHAYAQGTDIHLASGQEKHLAHEAWHVVQQKQGRVKPTLQMKGKVNVNDDEGLEKEADLMASKIGSGQPDYNALDNPRVNNSTIQRVPMESTITGITHVVQAVNGSIYNGIEGQELMHGQKIEVETSDRIRSRRGPNQEIFGPYDAKNATEYRWVKLIRIDGEPAPENAYVRDDTFEGGAEIPTGSVRYPKSIDHRQRLNPDLPPRTFAPEHAAQWYERDLGHKKSSTADKKHAKLLAIAFNTSPDETSRAMIHHADDPDMLMTLETVGQHMTHVAPWISTDVEAHGKDRHEGYDKSGEYYRTSQTHPAHDAFEKHQRALGFYKEAVTTDPVNPGWAFVAEKVMGVSNMRDQVKDLDGFSFRVAQDPDRISKGTGALIGQEEMARETAKMQQQVLKMIKSGKHELATRDFERDILETDEQIHRLRIKEIQLREESGKLSIALAAFPGEKKALGPKISAAKSAQNDKEVERLSKAMAQLISDAKRDEARLSDINKNEIPPIPMEIARLAKLKADLEIKQKLQEKYRGSRPGGGKLQRPGSTDLSPLSRIRPEPGVPANQSFAAHLLANRTNVKLPHLFGPTTVSGITDVSGNQHPNLILEKEDWKRKDGTEAGLKELQEGWRKGGLKIDLQERGSFGHHRPSVSPLDKGRVRINPGLLPMTLLQMLVGHAVGATSTRPINPREDFIHRHALRVAVQHALAVIGADRPGKSEKIRRIKEFAKHRLMINILKAQVILKAPIPKPQDDPFAYLDWLEKDFSKTSLALENINESTHLLLSARVNEESKTDPAQKEEPLLQPGPFQHFVSSEFSGYGKVAVYYVASGMQAITTAAIAAVHYRRTMKGESTGRKAGYVRLHPYFEMKDKVAAASGFDDASATPETIISDLSPVDTTVSAAEQSREAVKGKLATAVERDNTLVPVLDATAFPLGEVTSMVPRGTANFIVVESLTKYAQMGSDKALGGRIIAVGSPLFLKITGEVLKPVEQNAGMIVSRVWFQSAEDARYSH